MNDLTVETKATEINRTRLRAYVRLVSNVVRTIDEVLEDYRVQVYLELIADYGWTIEMVDARYAEAVKKELGI